MEDLVAVEVTTTHGDVCYFVTWGRVQDPVDPRPLERLILSVAERFALPGPPARVRVCDALREARDAPLFYEALFDFAQRPIPFGPAYEQWRGEMDAQMRRGKQIYFAGPWQPAQRE
jgi:hypothetical protein